MENKRAALAAVLFVGLFAFAAAQTLPDRIVGCYVGTWANYRYGLHSLGNV